MDKMTIGRTARTVDILVSALFVQTIVLFLNLLLYFVFDNVLNIKQSKKHVILMNFFKTIESKVEISHLNGRKKIKALILYNSKFNILGEQLNPKFFQTSLLFSTDFIFVLFMVCHCVGRVCMFFF